MDNNFDNHEKQKLLLSYLISSQDLFAKVQPILDETYFDPRLKGAAKFLRSYYEEYKAIPSADQIAVETGQRVEPRGSVTRSELTYAENEFEAFCKNKAIEKAIYAAPNLIADGKYGDVERLIKDAIAVGLNRNLGLDYFADPEARLRRLASSSSMIATLWIELDQLLGGGINRQEMTMFAAPSGVGKSLTMSNLARNLTKQKLNGAYVSLELAEDVVAKRFDSMITGIGQIELLRDITKTSIEIKSQDASYGRLFIKRMAEGSTASDIRAYLKEFEMIHGYIPDFLVVDYLDIMGSVQKVSVENQFIKDKYVAEELRAIANDFNLIMITASQLGRSAQQIETADQLNQANIAGGISKINTTDNLIAIIQTDMMKAKNEYMFKMLKTRSSGGVGSHFFMNFDPVSLLITCREGQDSSTRTMASGLAALANRDKARKLLNMNNQPKETPPWEDDKSSKTDNQPTPKPKAGFDLDNLPFQ